MWLSKCQIPIRKKPNPGITWPINDPIFIFVLLTQHVSVVVLERDKWSRSLVEWEKMRDFERVIYTHNMPLF